MDFSNSRLDALSNLYAVRFGVNPVSVSPLPAGGGGRRYFRMASPAGSAVACLGDSLRESRSFVGLARCLRADGASVPDIYGVSSDGLDYLQEDLGDLQLFNLVTSGPESVWFPLAEEVMRRLVVMQCVPESEWSEYVAYPEFGRDLVMFDLNYFKYCFLKPAGVDFDESALQREMEAMTDRLIGVPDAMKCFMMRDCQSRNVIVNDDDVPSFIDFQGGRKGPGLYDAVSFIWQAKADYSQEVKTRLMDVYIKEYCRVSGVEESELRSFIPDFALFRMLQVMGAYGFRGLVERKAHFLESLRMGLANLRRAASDGWLDSYPELKRTLQSVFANPRFAVEDSSDGRLHVKVFSFSYKKGYPEDLSGNGGGFMFDCRAMHNPGRYDEFKPLTGRDRPVRDFLQERGEVDKFLLAAMQLVDPAVQRYLQRGFTGLQVGFGCTGGRHRSVYCAQAMAEYLARRYPSAVIELIHREQGITETYNL